MKRILGTIPVRLVICLLVAVLLAASAAWAKPTTPDQAKTVVLNWLALDAAPLGAPLGRQIKEVQTFSDDAGNPAYYVVYLNPAGLVFLPADDLVEPIIGFLPEGQYDPSPVNPLGALVSRDLTGRVLQARDVEAKGLEALTPDAPQAVAQRKWAWLANPTPRTESSEFGIPSISDVRVTPLVQSKWDQSTVSGAACYNYYTPMGSAGSASNYVCGCVATAMAQLMRFWNYPDTGVGTGSYAISYWDGTQTVSANRNLRGGNGAGAVYNWGAMVLDPATSGIDLAGRQAIGALTYDAGLSVNMDYNPADQGGSGTDTCAASAAFVNTFHYSNAKNAYSGSSSTSIPATNRNNMVNPNLDAGYPTMLGIRGSVGGHAIVCDGYGYNSSTLYHHLNMGWSGSDNAWYNLPTIDTSWTTFDVQYKVIYNVYKTGTGEIISGRVTESNGTTPISGVTVTATGTGGPYTATTNANGIYALPKVHSGTAYTVSASKTGYTFTSQAVTTGTSTDLTTTTGNKWGLNFVASGGPSLNLNQALDNTRLSFNNLDAAVWFPETASYYYGGSAAQSGVLSDAPAGSYVGTRLRTTVVGPGTLSFYWKVSSEQDYDYLDLFIDSANPNWISGEVGWTKVTKAIPAGIHTVTWQYGKDESVSMGSDCGWVDKVVYSRPGAAAISLLLLN